jgi:nucleoside-diphosphate-sugar epimerase
VRILVLGGTVFLGRHFVDAALRAGHQVTTFTRGKTNPDLHPDAEKLTGDRDGGLEPLKGKTWDAVIDTSGYFPRVVSDSAKLLKDSVGRYLFVSSISVYSDFSGSVTEDSPVGTLDDETVETIDENTYGPLKVLCENVVIDVYGDRATVVRPGLIVGPHDPTDRFTYWPVRVARGGRVLAPAPRERQIQYIDARDLAEWMLVLIEDQTSGVFNATGLEPPASMEMLLHESQDASGSDAEFEWVDEDFLMNNEVGPWMELPLWLPDSLGMVGIMAADISRAVGAGLKFRHVRDTVADTLAWFESVPPGYEIKTGLAPEKEKQLLEQWANSQ